MMSLSAAFTYLPCKNPICSCLALAIDGAYVLFSLQGNTSVEGT